MMILDWDTDPKWSNDEWLREHFHMPKDLPKNLGPPWFLGVAKLWDRDQEHWSWIGWRNWHCIHSGDVYYQEFEHGIIMGGFHLNPNLKKGEEGAVLFILTDNHNNHRWASRQSPMEPPKCIITESMK